ncbi:elongation factor Ts [Candidatus Parcubacteria bacterium]|nr:elongation factor Ts [Candidatus Parcubacteria bacterium]
MEISTAEIKALRDETGLSISDIRNALSEAKGDKGEALKILQKRSVLVAQKKGERNLGAGSVASYIHGGGTSGVLIYLACETDFVSKNEEFKTLARDIAMHIAAMKPENAEELLAQPFIKDPSKTIGDLVNGAVQKFGERTEVVSFTRYSVAD